MNQRKARIFGCLLPGLACLAGSSAAIAKVHHRGYRGDFLGTFQSTDDVLGACAANQN